MTQHEARKLQQAISILNSLIKPSKIIVMAAENKAIDKIPSIVTLVCAYQKLPEDTFYNRKMQTKHVSYARHLAFYLLRKHTSFSCSYLGTHLGYSTWGIEYGHKQILNLLSYDTITQFAINELEKML